MCDYCFSDREHLKVGSGTVCQGDKHKRVVGTMEVVIVISYLLETTQHCSRSCDGKQSRKSPMFTRPSTS
ncbi:hypothetical protein ISN44_As04g038380 [Arabidopsis suecica]|uniref:Uncharacterized protein n=1 Tax=Arabidopsis suecica TaxID=45249 RepID=A0A8T2EL00_ARASU|nr:hypothetical protein ISN44_As04g038380 [Arabidopsis suecica]KAG7623111.1 hypothetical protein ISN44_As04g038380 [Arabidopsis suecica]